MAVRHEVENLIRRGNIFYWRPRIPAHFTACPSGSRLSLSLQVSDHRKAQMVARRLNTRLAEMRFVERERMSTREQLQKLFIQVRDEMLDHLEDVSVAAKRNAAPTISRSSSTIWKWAGPTSCSPSSGFVAN